jgi:betaine reductase
MNVVVKEAAYVVIHVPDFVRYGSKPSRDIAEKPDLIHDIQKHLRSYKEVIDYGPHQVFIGNKQPDELNDIPKPWYEHPIQNGDRLGPFGEILPEDEFYGWMKSADDFDLLWLDPHFIDRLRNGFASHPLVPDRLADKLRNGKSLEKIKEIIKNHEALPVYYHHRIIGAIRRDHDKDDTLKSEVLMENLMAKASGALAMLHLINKAKIKPEDVSFVLDCTEAAIGDRYNRGGGSMSKAMAEMCGCINATGHDIRAFCCAPNHAIINAAGLIAGGIFENVIVCGGGCLAKVGMKYTGHLKHQMPILEDVIAGIAFLITKDDGVSPIVRLDAVGKHDVGAGSPQQAILTSLILKPLSKIGMKMTDIDKYATEMHNPEITLPAGSGDTPATNYSMMAALAVLDKQIDKTQIKQFVRERGMPGFSPTQGHVPSSVPFLGHAIKAMKTGKMKRAMFVAKGSLFLGRMSQLSDGMSFLLESNSRNSST